MNIRHALTLIALGATITLASSDGVEARKHKKTKAPTPVPTTATPVPTTETPVGTVTAAAITDDSVADEADSTSSTTTSSGSSSHATFGTITSGSNKCVVGDPADGYISTSDVNWIYSNRMAADVTVSNALIFDQIYSGNGTLNYCIRWDSKESLSLATASKFRDALKRQYKAWNHWLVGYDCWPWEEIDIKIAGIAVYDESLLDWTDDSLGDIYVNQLDADGVPMCPDACYKHLGGQYNADTSSCTGTPFDLSLWPTTSLGDVGGYGGWFGQEVVAANLIANLDEDSIHILAHEIGHGYGLPDFYENADFPNNDPTDFPKCIMQAGASMTVTEGDGWMLRRAWEAIRSRYVK